MNAAAPRPLLGISSCLLGREVRWDGGHRHDGFLTGVLGPWVEWVPVCPEVEIGLGTPRPPIRLERGSPDDGPRLVMPSTGEDLTVRMRAWASDRLEALVGLGLCGYVLKADSPSCGSLGVPVHGTGDSARRDGRGLFAGSLVARFPWLPAEEEGRLRDPRLRETFVGRVFALHRWREMERGGITRPALSRFHERHELQLMARDRGAPQRLGRLLAEAPHGADVADLAVRYLDGFSEAMSRPPRREGHADALGYVAGLLTDLLGPADRAELAGAILAYRRGLAPLAVPLSLLRRWARELDVAYLRTQVYVDPHPAERSLLSLA